MSTAATCRTDRAILPLPHRIWNPHVRSSSDLRHRRLPAHARAGARPRQAGGHRSHGADLAAGDDRLPVPGDLRVGGVGVLPRHLLRHGGERQFADDRLAGVPVAGVPARFDLCAEGLADQNRRRPQGQEGRHSAMDADRGHLCARLDAARLRRAAHFDRLGAGRRQRCRQEGNDHLRAAARLSTAQRAGQDARRHAGERRARRRDLGAGAQRRSSKASTASSG